MKKKKSKRRTESLLESKIFGPTRPKKSVKEIIEKISRKINEKLGSLVEEILSDTPKEENSGTPEETDDFIVESSTSKCDSSPRSNGDSVVEISLSPSEEDFSKIINEARSVYDISKLEQKLEHDKDRGLEEGKRQIDKLLVCNQGLIVRTNKYAVLFAFRIGKLLNVLEEEVEKKQYIKWLYKNFGSEHTRYFQQARRIAGMGDFALRLSAVGKNRLLAFDRLLPKGSRDKGGEKDSREVELGQVLSENPIPDIATDDEGVRSKLHIDAAITYQTLKSEGVDVADFEAATLIAAYSGWYLEVKEAQQIKRELDKVEDKAAHFDRYLMNKMVFSHEGSHSARGESLRSILSRLITYFKNGQFDESRIESLKTEIDKKLLDTAFCHLRDLADHLGVKIEAAKSSENEPTGSEEE